MVALQEVRKPQTMIGLEPLRHTRETLDKWMTWLNDPDIRKWMYDDLPRSPEDINLWLYNATYDPKRHYFTITADGKQIGFVSLRQDQKPDSTGEIGIVIGEKEYQGHGIGTQTVRAIVDYAKDTVHLSAVRAMIKPDNEKSIHIFTAAGFIRTGGVTIQGTPMIRFEKALSGV